jgi:beta-glucanase (GH16 family)
LLVAFIVAGAGLATALWLPAQHDAADAADGAIVWQDEFNAEAGTPVDGAKWAFETGGSGFGNHERQYYTDSTRNAVHDGDGNLVITARRENPHDYRCHYGTCRYTSARLTTAGRFSQQYGRFEARMKLPRGQGMWPAFWMLGDDVHDVGWPHSGSIGIMEHIGSEPDAVHGTLHGPGYSGAENKGGTSRFEATPDEDRTREDQNDGDQNDGDQTRQDQNDAGRTDDTPYADEFHTYAVDWSPDAIVWYLDDVEYHRATPASLDGDRWVFDHPFHLLLNLAVGGDWPESPDGDTDFPQSLTVDYVRVTGRTPPPAKDPTSAPVTTKPKAPPATPPAVAPTTAKPPAAKPWAAFTLYKANQVVAYGGKRYQVRHAHTSLPGWQPPNVPALFVAG